MTKKHFWFGRELTDEQLEAEVSSRLDWAIPKTDFNCEEVIRVIGEWSKGLSLSLDHTFKKELIKFCSEEELRAKVIKELGSFEKLKMRRVDFSGNYFERRSPLGVVTHILPGNSEGLSFLACIESLLVGNINIIKLSQAESDLSIQLAKDLINFDNSGVIKERIAFLRLSSGSKALDKILSLSQGVSAWGGDSALSAIRSKISPQVAFIPWGHKISFSLVSGGEMNESQFVALAHDVIDLNQQACSSPQVIFYECSSEDELKEFAQVLMPYLASASKEKGPLTLTQQERAEIQNEGMVYQFMESQQEGFFIESEDVRILGKMKFELGPSPLNRTVHLRPINREVLVETLLPWREYLQTCGLCSSKKTEFLEWSKLLFEAGINRVCLPGKMVDSYSGEPHDGQYALERLSKVVRVELENGELNTTLFGRPLKGKSENSELMDKEAFQNQSDNGKAQFYFKSGGSSGTPKISRFTYQDYHSQMLAASDGLIAADLDPNQDRVVNLFFGEASMADS